MREIKFRAWFPKDHWISLTEGHKDTGCFIYDYQATIYEECETLNPDEKDIFIEQYTGLKDMEGKEIYEGDIMEYYCQSTRYFSEITYSEGSFWMFGNLMRYILQYSAVVIGNIHENKELLNE